VRKSGEKLHGYLAQRFRTLLDDENFIDSLPGHLPGDAATQLRVPILIERIKALTLSTWKNSN